MFSLLNAGIAHPAQYEDRKVETFTSEIDALKDDIKQLKELFLDQEEEIQHLKYTIANHDDQLSGLNAKCNELNSLAGEQYSCY